MCTSDIIYFHWQPALGVAHLHPVVAGMGSSLSAVWVAIESMYWCLCVCMDERWMRDFFFSLDKEDTLSSLWIIKPFEELISKRHIATDVFLCLFKNKWARWKPAHQTKTRVLVHVVLFNVSVKTLDFKFPIMFTWSSCPFTHQCFFYMSVRLEPSNRIFLLILCGFILFVFLMHLNVWHSIVKCRNKIIIIILDYY